MLQTMPSAYLSHGFEVVTPEAAEQMLLCDDRSRPVNDVRVAQMARDMTNGAWRVNGEAVVFDDAGRLLDGRKRLLACTMSDTAFKTLVVRGVSRLSVLSIDSRKTRRLADLLTIDGYKRGQTVQTVVKHILAMSEGGWERSRSLPPHVLRALVNQNPGIEDSLERAYREGRNGKPTLHAAMHFVFSRIDRLEADRFFDQLYAPDAFDLTQRDPCRSLARRLAKIAELREIVADRDVAALFVTAWNAFHSDTKNVRFTVDPAASFPEIAFWESCHAIRPTDSGARMAAAKSAADPLGNLEVEVVHVDPELAADWLEQNTSNRRPSGAQTARYARDMAAGQWQLNGETVKFGRSGRLLDGQHRLAAVIASGETVTMMVVNGLDEAVFDTIDIGERRSFAMLLAERRIRHASVVAPALKIVMCTEQDRAMGGFLPTNAEYEDALERHPGIVECCASGPAADCMEPSLAAALSYLLGRSQPGKAAEFFRKLDGVGTFTETDPVRHLLKRLGERRRDGVSGGDSPTVRLQFCITAWNAFCQGRQVSHFKVKCEPGRTLPAIA